MMLSITEYARLDPVPGWYGRIVYVRTPALEKSLREVHAAVLDGLQRGIEKGLR